MHVEKRKDENLTGSRVKRKIESGAFPFMTKMHISCDDLESIKRFNGVNEQGL